MGEVSSRAGVRKKWGCDGLEAIGVGAMVEIGEGTMVLGRLSGGFREIILVTLPLLVLSKPSNSTSRYDGLRGTCPTTYGRPFSVGAGFQTFLELENKEGSRRRRPPMDSASCCRYSSGTNSSKRMRVVAVRGSDVPEVETVLANGRDLKSTYREVEGRPLYGLPDEIRTHVPMPNCNPSEYPRSFRHPSTHYRKSNHRRRPGKLLR